MDIYSLQGMAARTHVLRVSGKRVSAIPVLTTRGIEDTFTTSNTVDGEKFEEFICQCVLPILLPFDGLNPRSVVIMDNASIHHLERVHDIVTGVGARLVFLPPYSPDLMPLEVFSKVKSIQRANDSVYIASSTPEIMVKLAFCAVTQDDCIQYIKHAGYMEVFCSCSHCFTLFCIVKHALSVHAIVQLYQLFVLHTLVHSIH